MRKIFTLKNLILVVLLTAIIRLTGCQSAAYYRSQTVKKAVAYATEHLKSLSELQLDYLRYTTPVIMQSVLFRSEGKKGKSPRDIVQTCVVWTNVPGLKEDVVVAGVSTRRLEDWTPIRVILKKFNSPDFVKAKAIVIARKYVMQNMPEISSAELNRVRFAMPEIRKTSFEINTDKKWIRALDEPTQISLLWNSDDKTKKIAVIGMGEPDLKSWKAVTGGKIVFKNE